MGKLGIWGSGPLYRILGIVFFVFGLLYFFCPGMVEKINRAGRKVLWKDEWSTGHRVCAGIFFLVAGTFVGYVGFVVFK